MDAAASTVLWRLFRPTSRDHIRAVILPGGPPFTLAFFAWFAAVTAGRETHFVTNWLLENRDASKQVVES